MTSPPRLLVTGASGAIGRRLRTRLELERADASYLVRPRSGSNDKHPSVDEIDITDRASLNEVIGRRKPNTIIHLAAVAGEACDSNPEHASAVNVEAVASLTELAQQHGVLRIIFASTCAVYGDQYDQPVSETGKLAASTRYAKMKLQGELILAESVASSTELSTVALRIFNVYGPGMDSSLPNRLLSASENSPVLLSGLDEFIRDYIHVDDVVDALIRAARISTNNPWLVANLGSGRPMSNRDLVTALEPVRFEIGPPRSSYSCADTSLATKILGFTSTRNLSRESVI